MTSDTPLRDESGLRRAILTGDEDAWRRLHDRHADALFAYVSLRARGDRHRAEEIAQECWMVAVRRIDRFDPRIAGFWSWLRGIADHTLANHHRRWGLRNVAEKLDPVAVDRAPDRDTAAPDPTEVELVQLALSTLAPRYQHLLVARFEEHLSIREIAAARGETTKAVEAALGRAREAFRREYARLEPREETHGSR